MDNKDVDAGNDVGSADITVRPAVDVGIRKSVLQFVALEGDTLAYVVRAANFGVLTVDSLTVLDVLDPALTYVGSVATNGVYDPGTGRWAMTNLAPGPADSLIVLAEVGSGTAGTVIENYAGIIFSSEADPDDSNDDDFASTLIVEEVDLHVTKSVGAPSYAVGDTVAYSISVQNLAPLDATSVFVEDVISRRTDLRVGHPRPRQLRSRSRSLGRGDDSRRRHRDPRVEGDRQRR